MQVGKYQLQMVQAQPDLPAQKTIPMGMIDASN